MLSKKLSDLEIAILEKKFDRALAILVEVFAAVVAMSAGSVLPLIQWKPKVPDTVTKRKYSQNDLICDAIRIASLASNRVPNKSGVMVCPGCGGKLKWNVHQTGKIWGTCETKDCLAFME